MPLQIRRGTEAERLSLTSANGLLQGELLYNTSDKRVYIGTGVGGEHQGIPVTGYTDENAQDAVSTMFTGGSHAGITFSYNDSANTLNATVDLSNYEGVLKADAFNGTLVADDSSVLVDAVDGKINLDGTVKGNIIPNANEAYDIGSASYKFKDLYLSGSSIYLGTANITSTAGVVNLPAGSTIGGVAIGTAVSQDTAFIRDLQGSVFGDDSTVLVNSIDNVLSSGVLSLDSQYLYTEAGSGFPVTLYGDSGSQTQVIFATIAAGTTGGGDIGTAGGNWKGIDIRAYKGDVRNPSGDMASGDVLGVLTIGGFNSSTGYDQGAIYGAQVDPQGTVTANHTPTKMFFINKGNTSSDPDTVMVFDSKGQLGVGKQIPEATLDIEGFAKLKVLNSAPTVSSDGDGTFAIADGTGWDPLGVPGKQQMVVYLGGAWRQVAVQP